MEGTEVKLLGTVHKVTVCPPKLNDQGQVDTQNIDILLRIPIDCNEAVRDKLPDLSRLQNGKTTSIILQAIELELFKDEETKQKKQPAGSLKLE